MTRPHATRLNNVKAFLVASLLAASTLLASTPTRATTIIGVEDPALGFVGGLLAGFPDYVQVASDGEVSFRPFGIGPDVSDAIYFGPQNSFRWVQAAESTWTDNGAGVWYLPAANPGPGCPPENETDVSSCHEAVGHWMTEDGPWIPSALGDYAILSADGSIEDLIRLYNIDNVAHITFASDPLALPEPSSLALVSAAVAAYPRKRRRHIRH